MAKLTTLFNRPNASNRAWLVDRLRDETIGGLLLLAAATVAMIWANSPWSSQYLNLISVELGWESLHLRLSIAKWATDGLLATFFFVVGLELKHELTVGSLSQPAQAAVPVAAAIGGMATPALIYLAVNTAASDGSAVGWGIPMATDIAFALAVLAVVGRRLPVALRAFLLTLAVVDDLGAIIVIALFYSSGISLVWLGAALVPFALFAYAQHRRWRSAWLYLPLALSAWWLMHNSGVHATVAGVILGLLTRVRPDAGEAEAPAERLQHRLHPFSAGVAVPLFAFTAAGIPLAGIDIASALREPVLVGVALGLVLGKPIGIFGSAWLLARFTRATLAESIHWLDVAAIGLLAGVGFTVALLISELAYEGSALLASAKLGVLLASAIAAGFSAVALLARGRVARAEPSDF